MCRPFAFGMSLSFVLAAAASAQFARPPVVAPPPPPPVFVPYVPTPFQPPPFIPNRPLSPPTGRPIRIVALTPGLMAVLGGTTAVTPAVPGGLILYQTLPVVYRQALAAVVGVTCSRLAAPWAGVRQPREQFVNPSLPNLPKLSDLPFRGPNLPHRPLQDPIQVPPPPVFVNEAAPPAAKNNGPGWMPWVIGGGVGVAVLIGLGVMLRPRGGRVRVFDVPPGEAPDWVRQAWVGVELPTLHKQPRPMPAVEVASGEDAGQWVGYAVDGPAAVRAVAAVDPEAVDWWRTNLPGVMSPGYTLIFPADVCEPIS